MVRPFPALMMTIISTLFILLAFFSSPSTSSSINPQHESSRDDVGRWCKETPHPYACEYYLAHSSTSTVHPPKIGDRPSFYRLSLHAALKRAVRARSRLRRLWRRRTSSRPNPVPAPGEVHALSDCMKLYRNTVLQLNRTIYRRECQHYDSQTWLSAALTNLDVCRKGFSVLNAPEVTIAPLSGYNVSDLISNCLFINKQMTPPSAMAPAAAPSSNTNTGWYPWNSAGQRRLLQTGKGDLVVAKSGSGTFRTIGAAVAAAAKIRRSGGRRLVILIKAGVYTENVQVPSGLNGITFAGEGKGRTIITGAKGVANGFTIITGATLAVYGDGFIARDMTIRNTFGLGTQAVALLMASDQSVLYRCSIEGYQDTLFAFSQRQFYRECDILGTIDFIFGNAAAIFQRCNILPRLPRHGESNVITAQARSDPNQNTGFVFQGCTLRPAPDLFPSRTTVKTFLGRPWMRYSRVLYLENFFDGFINSAGWLPWSGNFALNTLYYGEYKNTGAGSKMRGRVRWSGYHIIVKPSIVRPFTVANFIAGTMWLPAVGMPFTAGLLS